MTTTPSNFNRKSTSMLSFNPARPEWFLSPKPVPYTEAVATMEARVDKIIAGSAPEWVWCLEHPPLYTAGTSALPEELTDPDRFPVFQTGRGGRYTYHGPGQRVVYVMCDLRQRGQDLRAHIARLEDWIIRALADFGVVGEVKEGRVGIWVQTTERRYQVSETDHPFLIPDTCLLTPESKIAAIGVRVRKWVTYHGLALNVNPDLSHFSGIVPCGLGDYGVTSLAALGVKASMGEVDEAFRKNWVKVFG